MHEVELRRKDWQRIKEQLRGVDELLLIAVMTRAQSRTEELRGRAAVLRQEAEVALEALNAAIQASGKADGCP